MAEKQRFATFYLDGLFLGVEVEKVQEVLRYQESTHVPLAPPEVRGLINLRGQIVTAIDLRRRLGVSECPGGHNPLNVVVRIGDEVVSFLVDEIGDVVEVGKETFEQPPQTLDAKARELIRGVHKLNNRLMLIIDAQNAMNLGVE